MRSPHMASFYLTLPSAINLHTVFTNIFFPFRKMLVDSMLSFLFFLLLSCTIHILSWILRTYYRKQIDHNSIMYSKLRLTYKYLGTVAPD
jgi:hypothetical protein